MVRPRLSPLDRFWQHVQKEPSGCWVWTGCVTAQPKGKPNSGGYGLFYDGAKQVGAHQWAYEHFVAPLPILPNGRKQGLDHFACDNPPCVNPTHLRPVSSRENILRSSGITSINRAKTHCSQGHPYDEANTWTDPTGRRHCRTCALARTAEWAARQTPETRPKPTHCTQGHVMDEVNAVWYGTSGSWRCRQCRRLAHIKRRLSRI